MRNALLLLLLVPGIFLVRDLRAQKKEDQAATSADRVTELEHKVQDLEVTSKLMNGDITQLKFDRMVDNDSLEGFQDSVDDLKHDLDGNAMNVTKLRSDVDELSKRVATLEEKLRDNSGPPSSTQGAIP